MISGICGSGALATISTPAGLTTSSGYVDATRASQYDPQLYQRYDYTTATDSEQLIDLEVEETQLFGSSSLTVSSSTSFTSISAPNTLSGPNQLANGSYVTTTANGVTYSGTTQTNNGIILPGTGITSNTNQSIENVAVETSNASYVTNYNSSNYLTETGSHRDCNWWTLCIASDEYLDYQLDQQFTTITTESLKADYPIAINFIGSNTGGVNIASAASVTVNGNIVDKAGTTSICAGAGCGVGFGTTSTPASIVQGASAPQITSQSLVLTAAGSVGSIAAPLQVTLSQAIQPGGALSPATGSISAAAASGVVAITTTGDLRVGAITAGGDPTQNQAAISLVAEGSIVAADANAYIQADAVSLTAVNGSIGSIAAPLTVNTGFTTNQALRPFGDPATDPGLVAIPYYGLTASAQGDIGIAAAGWSDNADGTILANTIVSVGGNVYLTTPGQILDNDPVQTIDNKTLSQLVSYWNSLQLTVDKSAANEAAFAQMQQTEYNEYWNIRLTQPDGGATYDPTFQVQILPGTSQYQALQAAWSTSPQFSGQTFTQYLTAVETAETSQYQALNAQVGGYTNSYQANFVYTPTATQDAALSSGAQWTEAELSFSISAGALKTVTSTNPVVKAPNVSGATVTLDAGLGLGETVETNGPGGTLIPGIQIAAGTDPTTLTDTEKAALASAERSDLALTVSGVDPAKFAALSPAQQAEDQAAYDAALALGAQTIPLGADPSTLTSAQQAMLQIAADGLAENAGTYLTILTKRPLNFEASQALNVSVTASPSTTLDIGDAYLASLGSAALGSIDVTGETRIKVIGSLTGAPNVSIQTGDLILEASQGAIGGAFDATTGAPTAPLALDLASGATIIGRSAKGIDLEFPDDANVDTLYSLGNITLAANGSILNANDDQLINILGTTVSLTAQNGSVGAAADPLNVGVNLGGGIYASAAKGSITLYGPDPDDFIIQQAQALGTVTLTASADAQILGLVQATGGVDVSAYGAVTLGPLAMMQSLGSDVVVDAASFQAAAGSQTWAADAIDLTATTGPLPASDSAGAQSLDIAGLLQADGDINLTAGGEVGLEPTAVVLSETGDISVAAASFKATDGSATDAQAGSIDIVTSGDAQVTGFDAGGQGPQAVSIAAGGHVLAGDDPTRSADITATATGAGVTILAGLGIGDETQTNTEAFDASGEAPGTSHQTTSTPNPLLIAAGTLDLTATTGPVYADTVTAVTGATILAVTGNVVIHKDTDFQANSIIADQGFIDVEGDGSLTLDDLLAPKGAIEAIAGTTLTIGSAQSGGSQTLSGETGVYFTSLTTTGVPGDAGNIDIASANGPVQGQPAGSSSIDAAGAVGVSGATVSLDQVASGTGTSITGTGAVTLASLAAGGTLDAASTNGSLTIGSAQSGGSQTLSGETGVYFTSLTTTGVPGDAGNIDIASANGPVQGQPAGSSSIDAAGAVGVSGATVSLDQVASGTGTSITGTGAVTLASLTAGATLDAASTDGALTIGSAQSGGSQTLSGETGVYFTSLTTTGVPGDAGNIDIASADGPVQGQPAGSSSIDAAGAVGVSGATVSLDQVASGTGTSITGTGAVTLASLTAGATLDAASTNGALTIGSAQSGGSQTLSGETGVYFTSLTTTGVPGDAGNIDIASTNGPVAGQPSGQSLIEANGDISIDALSVTLDEVTSGGSMAVRAEDGLSIADLTAGGSARLSAGGDVALGEARVGDSLAVASSSGQITIGSAQSGGSQTLSGEFRGLFHQPGDDGRSRRRRRHRHRLRRWPGAGPDPDRQR